MKPVLVLQLRPEDAAADDEFAAFLRKGGLAEDEVHRVRLEREDPPPPERLGEFAAILAGGGPGCVSDPPEAKSPEEARAEAAMLRLMPAITGGDLPFLGCCYGIGVLAHHLGAEVSKRRWSEPVGPARATLTEDGAADPLLSGLPGAFDVLVGHKEAVQALPPGCAHLVSGASCPIQMIRHGRNVYATQFHPESGPENFELRIEIYLHRGYFDPAEAGALAARCRVADVTHQSAILRRFVDRYRAPAPGPAAAV